jgi:NAD(P)-dependent dehydrogenase (short-subunit alcohol dehydrogenase family)
VRPIAGLALEQWDYIMDVNIEGAFLCSRDAANTAGASQPCLRSNKLVWDELGGDPRSFVC